MKIFNDLTGRSLDALKKGGKAGADKVAGKDAKGKEVEDAAGEKVSFSDDARGLEALKQAASGLPDVRMQKVNEIKDALSSGSYHVSNEDVADKILDDVI